MEGNVSLVTLIEYADASAEVKAVYDDIMRTRGVDWVNNFWKALANDPAQLRRIWDNVKQVMAPGALDPLVKEMVYVAVSATNGCEYCTYSHTAAARKKGMTDAMLMELLAVAGLANETNRLGNGTHSAVLRANLGGHPVSHVDEWLANMEELALIESVSHKEEDLDFTGTFNIAEVRAQLEAMAKEKQKQKSSST